MGMVLVVAPADAARALKALRESGETAYEIGIVEQGAGEAQAVIT
ncbi:MAG TPA: AIR synthase-related protein [Burkholderiales bacterium]